MIKLAAFCLWALLTAVISYRAVTVKAPAIEEDIRARTTEVIAPQSAKVAVEVDGRFVTLRGPAKDEPAKSNHLATGDAVWGALGPTDALWVPEALKSNYYLSAVKNLDGSVNLAGILPSNAAKEALSTIAVSYFKDAVSNKIGVSLPDGTDQFAIPPDALQALSALDAGTLLVAPEGITLSGSTASGEVAANAQGLEARADTPWRVFVSSPPPAPVAADGGPPPAAMYVSKTPDGTIEARGVLASEAAKAKILKALRNGGSSVIDLLSVQATGLPEDWDDRTLKGVQSMKDLDWATLSLEATSSNLRGGGDKTVLQPIVDGLGAAWASQLTPRPEAPVADNTGLAAALADRDSVAERAAALEAELAALKSTPAVPATEPAPAAEVAAAADDCATNLKALLKGRRITFESGSAALDQSSVEFVGQLANAAKPCIDTSKLSLIISGHTDNTGRPAKNLELSRLRADSVRTAFIQRGLAADAMTSRGFGEMKPIGDNRTESGREINRRIGFDWTTR
jgi:outer membrane protein OmpA-like peptidoglycan-associated protein